MILRCSHDITNPLFNPFEYNLYIHCYICCLKITREAEDGLPELKVNIDSRLHQILKEVHHLQRPPLEIRLPDVIRSLIRNTDPALLQTNAVRLSTVVSHYNKMTRTIDDIEKPLFDIKLFKIEQVRVLNLLINWMGSNLQATAVPSQNPITLSYGL